MNKSYILPLLLLGAALLFIPMLGGVHLFDWDEINFAECAREMMVTGDYLRPQIDFMPFWEKPPLFIWLQVASMQIAGIGAFAARLPNALVGIASVAVVYHFGKKIYNYRLALYWVAMLVASWLPHFYFKTGIIDPLFNLLIVAAFIQVHLLASSPTGAKRAVYAGLLLGLAVLTKGPVAILVAMLCTVVYIITNKGIAPYKLKHLIIITLFATLPMLGWMVLTAASHGVNYSLWFLSEFVQYQIRLFSTEDSDHGGPFIYHFVVLLLGCFPASVFFIHKKDTSIQSSVSQIQFKRWMSILFWVVLILFSIVKTKIVHYSSLCYYPLTFLAAHRLYMLHSSGLSLSKTTKTLLLTIGSIIAIVIIAIPLVGMNKDALVPYIADKFAVANLRADVPWHPLDTLWGIGYLLGIWGAVRLMKQQTTRGIITLIVVQIAAIQAVILFFTAKIEGYSQRAAISFFKSHAKEEVYVQPLGYKSYANLFYTNKQAINAPEYKWIRRDETGRETPEANVEWLLHGQLERQAYFICKITDSTKYAAEPKLQLIGSKNGFVFFKRK